MEKAMVQGLLVDGLKQKATGGHAFYISKAFSMHPVEKVALDCVIACYSPSFVCGARPCIGALASSLVGNPVSSGPVGSGRQLAKIVISPFLRAVVFSVQSVL